MATRTGKIRQDERMVFVDSALADCGGRRTAALLARLDATTLWATLSAPVRELPEYRNRGAGHPPWCPARMLKCLMLQKWFNLSDPVSVRKSRSGARGGASQPHQLPQVRGPVVYRQDAGRNDVRSVPRPVPLRWAA